jgi:YggT family protein
MVFARFSASGRHLGPGFRAVKDAAGKPKWRNHCRTNYCSPFSCAPQAAIRQSAYPTERLMNPFLWLVDTLITLYIWILIASAVLSWLVAFNVVNTRNPIVHSIGDFLYRITEPALRPIRNFLPNLGGIDISPVILILLLLFAQRFIFWLYVQIFV